MPIFYVYVIQSQADGRFYKGMTSSLQERIDAHNSGYNTSTKYYRPWKLVYFEKFDTREQAREREKFLKSGQGRNFILSILQK